MKQAAMQRIILFVGLLLINIDSGDCAIRAKGDYKTTLAEINGKKGYLYFVIGQAPGASGAAGQSVTPPWTLGVAGGGGAESGGQLWRPRTLWSVWSAPRQSQQ